MARSAIQLVCLLTLVGCASMGGYRPTVDPYNDKHANRIPQDEEECRQLAARSTFHGVDHVARAVCRHVGAGVPQVAPKRPAQSYLTPPGTFCTLYSLR